ncbi:hypothetical protein SAMN04488693_101630 [Arthrobacter subterraneus]|uniref:Uncharacterized protein n=1 Tax=Arthrobacter subterraneus TaxID=335973 RepID=A0A1G8DK49_9MICC|nr:DUF6480 family protein [Arthrobacter subterraneus]SDH58036.1 hypothetical protein SAMN04488693_101630 [Arthrobacter subterraneus]
MSAPNPDPEQDKVAGLEPGGGVPPGETPPGEASTAAPQGHDEEAPSGRGASFVWLAAIGVFVLLGILLFVGYIGGLFS